MMEYSKTKQFSSGRIEIAVATAIVLVSVICCPVLADRVTVKGNKLQYRGQDFVIRGIEYSPWGPGTGPGRGSWPGIERISKDLEMIEQLGCNVVSVVDPPESFFQAVGKTNLMVIYTMGVFQAQWEDFGSKEFVAREKQFKEAFERHKADPRIFLWVLGRELTPIAFEKHGAEIADWFETTSRQMRSSEPGVLVSHANWPPTRSLKFDSSDMVCFDLYPGWPPEVSLTGFGKYIKTVLLPLTRKRPLLITEFGVNSLEVSLDEQGPLLAKCWSELREAGACGAVVFSFMDEWWKNYDNPISATAWWARKPAPDDAKTLDKDPEEHYGLVRADRRPKPAYKAVQKMFGQTPAPLKEDSRMRKVIIAAVVFVMFLAVLQVWALARSRIAGGHVARSEGADDSSQLQSKRRSGFTLIELLVVIAIIALLMAILVPVLSRARELAKRASCLENLHQIHVSMTMYADDNGGKLPPRVEKSGQKIWCNWLGSDWNPYGLGFLIKNGYVSEPKIFYCPSNRICKFKEQYWFSIKGSESWMTYRYRNNNWAGHPPKWSEIYVPEKISDRGGLAIVADDPYLDWVKYAHKTGYNVVYLDGHGSWVNDNDNTINGDLYEAWKFFDQNE